MAKRTISVNATPADGSQGWGLARWSRKFHYWVSTRGVPSLCGRVGGWPEVRVADEPLADTDHGNADNCKRCQQELAKRHAYLPTSVIYQKRLKEQEPA